VFEWDPVSHLMARVEVRTGNVRSSAVPQELRPIARDTRRYPSMAFPGLVLSPDGQRAYAVGSAQGQSTTGIWVFDTATLELIDHWEARAAINSIAVSADGRFVYAAGAPGLDVDGNENQAWQASVTVYDAATGEQVRLYGEEGANAWLNFPARP
jgi:hypothetical protein